MNERLTVVVTSIAAPNKALRKIAEGCRNYGVDFIVVGDKKSPPDFYLEDCDFITLDAQLQTGLRTAQLCPLNTYSRKNIGYLLAIRNGTEIIVDTDDDNLPTGDFWRRRTLIHDTRLVSRNGWINVYRYFTLSGETIWPRGLPLDRIHSDAGEYELLPKQEVECPIQQGLVDANPDVDAIYRLALPLPITFRKDRKLALGRHTWSPFNSQNTAWWKEAFPLLYLPSFCSFRMTDIWRSFVAQRIAWENNWCVLFHEPTAVQERNEHDLMKDFADEISGYLQNTTIGSALETIRLKTGPEYLGENLLRCYEKLVRIGAVGKEELPLVKAWVHDLERIGSPG